MAQYADRKGFKEYPETRGAVFIQREQGGLKEFLVRVGVHVGKVSLGISVSFGCGCEK